MAEEVASEEDEDEWDDDATVEEIYGDDALRGFRFFMNNVNGLEHHAEDVEEEEDVIEAEMDLRRRLYHDIRLNDNGEMILEEEEEPPKPSAVFVAQTLTEQGVTVEQLVKALMADHEEYQDDDDIERINDEIFGKLRIIISNYTPGAQVKNRPEIDEPRQTIMVDV
jgi:hypothetical protein